MANTKKFTDRAVRKGIKRSQRSALKALRETLSPTDRKSLRKEPMGLRKYLATKETEAK